MLTRVCRSTCFGSLGAAYLADHVGRKWVYALALVFSYVGITLEFVSTTNAVFFGGKFIKYVQHSVTTGCIAHD